MNKLYIVLLIISAIVMFEMSSVMLGQSARIQELKQENEKLQLYTNTTDKKGEIAWRKYLDSKGK